MRRFAFVGIVGGAFLIGFALGRHPAASKETVYLHLDRDDTDVQLGSSAEIRSPAAKRPSRWHHLESQDEAKLAANLRSVGCPEQLISRILSTRISLADPSNYVALSVQPPQEESRFGFSAEKQARVDEALAKFPKQTPVTWTEELLKEERSRRKQRVEYLSSHLSPEELLTYRISEDGDTTGVARTLQGFNATEEEFKEVFQVLDGRPFSTVNGYFDEETETQLLAALGPDRYAEYHTQVGPGNAEFNHFLAWNQIEPEAAAKLSALRNHSPLMSQEAYEAEVSQLLKEPRLVRMYFMNRLVNTPPRSTRQQP